MRDMTPPLTRSTPPYRACLAGTFVASKYAHLLIHNYYSSTRGLWASPVSRREHHTAQTQELVATKHVLLQVIARGELFRIHTIMC